MQWKRSSFLNTLIAFIILSVLSFDQSSAQSPSLEWAKVLGGTGNDEGLSIATDLAGNVFTTGRFNGTADFDPGPGTFNLTSAGSDDIFISKLDATGNFAWALGFGSTSADRGRSITIDPTGNILITGDFRNTIDFNPGVGVFNLTAPSGLFDNYILKLDNDGNFIWAVAFGDPLSNADISMAVASDASGNVYTTGNFSGTVDFDPGPGVFNLTSVGGGGFTDVFILKLNPLGNFIWAKSIGGTSSDHAYAISIDPSSNVIVGGDFIGTTDFDPGAGTSTLTPVGFLDPFVLKLDSDGNYIWAKSFGGGSTERIRGISTDASGNIFSTGDFDTTIDLDPGSGTFNQSPRGSTDIFISKLDPDGNFLWGAGIGDNQEDVGRSVTVDEFGNSYFTGHYASTVDFDPGSEVFNLSSSTPNTYDIFIAKYDPSGNLLWAGSMGGNQDFEMGNSIKASAGNIYVTGAFYGTSDFDPGSETFTVIGNGTLVDAFVVKLRTIPSLPTITSFTPGSGLIGISVTITGTNFSTTPSNNIVMFNGTSAVVTASTTTSITCTVPASATTGKISVTVAGNTATSASDFTIQTTISHTITNFSPTSGPIGTTVTISGTNFSTIPSENTVMFNGTIATVLSCTTNSITTAVPSGATSGKITVTLSGNIATSALDFTITTISNQPPVINTTETTVSIAGSISIDLTLLISDSDNNLDLTTLKIVSQPLSGAFAQITNNVLIINYTAINFSGQDRISIEACDLLGSCTQQELTINVVGDLIIYTGISPNGDPFNEKWIIQNIESMPGTRDNKVSIYNRWGDLVFETKNYDNKDRVFKGINKSGDEVSSGVYFYKIEFANGNKDLTGYLSVKK